jgi:hypothetical protein
MPGFYAHEDAAAFFNLELGRTYHFRQDAWHHLPGFCVVQNRFYLPENQIDDEDLGPIAVDHTVTIGITPANDRMFYHMTALSTSFPLTQACRNSMAYVVNQDVDAAAKMQTYFERHWQDAAEVSVPSDRIALRARLLVSKMVKAETAESSTVAAVG